MPAYLSSVYSSSDLSNEILIRKLNFQIIDDYVLGLIDTIPRNFISENDEMKRMQRNWDLPMIKEKFSEMFDSSESVASSTKESSKWLQDVPSSNLGLLLDNNTARIVVCHAS